MGLVLYTSPNRHLMAFSPFLHSCEFVKFYKVIFSEHLWMFLFLVGLNDFY